MSSLFVFAPVVLIWLGLLLCLHGSLEQLVLLLPALLIDHIAGFVLGLIGPCVPFSVTQAESKGMGNGCLTMILGTGMAIGVGILSSFAWKQGWFAWWILGLTGFCLILELIFRSHIRDQPLWTDD